MSNLNTNMKNVLKYLREGDSVDLARSKAGLSRTRFEKFRKESPEFDARVRVWTGTVSLNKSLTTDELCQISRC